MANTEHSKLKLLYLYHYFRKYVKAEPPEDGTSMSDMLSFLNEMTGEDFERKSVYSDITRLNTFARTVGLCEPYDDWISLDGKTYKRGEVIGDLTFDEARLIVDAINATDFIDSGLCEKIKAMYPTYFKAGYNSVIPHDDRSAMKKYIYYLNTIRRAIDEGIVITFKYGYLVASGIRGASEKKVSPLGLDFNNSHYYLIAVDNEEVENGTDKQDAIKNYRLDRIRGINLCIDDKYITFKNRDETLRKFVKSSVDAYAYKGRDDRTVMITLTSDDEKRLLKAYTGFADNMKTSIISDRINDGTIVFSVRTGLVPPFFQTLFKVSMYEGVTMVIDDEDVKKKYSEYLNKALGSCKLQ